MDREDLEKTFYLIAKYWLGELQGFIKIGNDKEEIISRKILWGFWSHRRKLSIIRSKCERGKI